MRTATKISTHAGRRLAVMRAALACVALAISACTTPAGPAKAPEARAPLPAAQKPSLVAQEEPPVLHEPPLLTRIESTSHICMLSNRYFGGRPQVPIDVGANTYFGCCGGCAKRLSERPDARVARDPVTGHAVDKASAVLAYDELNRVHYFESESTFARFAR
jgi:hypothetical protein